MAVRQLLTLEPTTSARSIRVLKRVSEVQTEPATYLTGIIIPLLLMRKLKHTHTSSSEPELCNQKAAEKEFQFSSDSKDQNSSPNAAFHTTAS